MREVILKAKVKGEKRVNVKSEGLDETYLDNLAETWALSNLEYWWEVGPETPDVPDNSEV